MPMLHSNASDRVAGRYLPEALGNLGEEIMRSEHADELMHSNLGSAREVPKLTLDAPESHQSPPSLCKQFLEGRYDPRYPDLLLQPNSRPISREQLSSEVKSIYAGLTMIENKCNHIDKIQAQAGTDPHHKLSSDHWQALIALHRTLLHEHHDFFLASQHPSASPALRRLATKYSMPARMWKHGIHSFLELLRRHLPDSIDHMLAFIYLSYQMVALLYETVTAFEDTLIECLGDLGRYRMALEDEDLRDRETWAGVARSWYTKAADKNPYVGRLYHHLAILARPNAWQQLYYYCRSLTCVKPVPEARESVFTLLDPILARAANIDPSAPLLVSRHQSLYPLIVDVVQDIDQFLRQILCDLDDHIRRVTEKWKEHGVYIASSNIVAWFEYGGYDHALHEPLLGARPDVNESQPLSFDCCCKQHCRFRYRPTGHREVWPQLKVPINRSIKRFRWIVNDVVQQQNSFVELVLKPVKGLRSVLSTYLCVANLPIVFAFDDHDLKVPTVQDYAPRFKVEDPLEYIVSGCMVFYLMTMLILRAKNTLARQTFRISFSTMISMGMLSFIVNRDEFADGIRSTVLQIWFTTTIHVVAQYCYDNYAPGLHIISFIGLSIVPGLVLSRFPSMNPLDILPPYTAVLALITWAVHEEGLPIAHRQRQDDPERGDPQFVASNGTYALEELTQTGRQILSVHHGQGDVGTSPALRTRRNSDTLPIILSNPSLSTLCDDPRE